MKGFGAAVFVATLLQCSTGAQAKPDFSGTWIMDSTRSESANQEERIGPVTVVISQTPSELRIETTKTSGSSVITYRLDGSEIKIPGGTAKAYWDGSTLVTEVEGYVQGQAVSTKVTLTLIGNGNEMLVNNVVIVQHGYSASTSNYGTGKDIYVRRR